MSLTENSEAKHVINGSPLPRSCFKRGIESATVLYCFGLFYWFAAFLLWKDRTWWLFFLNSFAIYLFAPLPLAVIGAIVVRRRVASIACTLSVLLFTWLFAGTLVALPSVPRRREPGEAPLSVMVFNVRGDRKDVERIVHTLEQSDADVVALQEVTPEIAEALDTRFKSVYPYSVMAPRPGVAGMGVIARHPLRRMAFPSRALWSFEPQLVEVDLNGQSVMLLNTHLTSTQLRSPLKTKRRSIHVREREAREIADYARACDAPLIVTADLNATPLSRAYETVAEVLTDAWRWRGGGLGHTFPGMSWRGLRILRWLVRIDYIFASPHWRVLDARLGPWDGRSDHRPVVVTLTIPARRGLAPYSLESRRDDRK